MENEKINILKEYFEKENENIERGKKYDYCLSDIKGKDIIEKNENQKDELKIEDLKQIYKKELLKKGDSYELLILYKLTKEKYQRIKLFGSEFVQENKNKCKLIIEGKEKEMFDHIYINKHEKENILIIKLKGINKVNKLAKMFYECISLIDIFIMSEWDTSNVKDMSYIFFGCQSLKELPDISRWNLNKVNNISYMFYDCSSLKSLPDISKWNTQEVNTMESLFHN